MTKKTYRFAAFAAVLLALLVFAAPVSASEDCTGCTTNDVEHNHVASMQNTSGTYYYTTLWDAANATQVGEQSTITLLGNTQGTGVQVGIGKKITFDFVFAFKKASLL